MVNDSDKPSQLLPRKSRTLSSKGGTNHDKTGTNGPEIKRTQPKVILRHDISDEELDQLADLNRGESSGLIYLLFGLSGGSLISCLEKLHNSYITSPQQAIPWYGLIEIILFSSSLITGIILSFLYRDKKSKCKDLIEEIRSRATH